MTAPKTAAQKQRDYRRRRIEAGLKLVRELWAHPDDHRAIRDHAATLAAIRAQKGKK